MNLGQNICRIWVILIIGLNLLGCNEDQTPHELSDQSTSNIQDMDSAPVDQIQVTPDRNSESHSEMSSANEENMQSPPPNMTSDTLNEYAGPQKKGIAIHQRTYDWSEKVAAVKPFWSYSWGRKKSVFQPDGIEFVPMIWSGSLNEEQTQSLRTQFTDGEINYLLGYNEPDGENQANMSVDRAIEFWPQLEATGIPLVSPSTVHYDNEWMTEFIRRAKEDNLRVDYLAFHWYGDADPQSFLNLLDRVYERYQLPIWITEFAPADWNADRRENNRISPEQVLSFMQTVLPELDRRDYIIKYAWFTDHTSNNLWPAALFNVEGHLTILGEFYAAHTANPIAGVAKPYPPPTSDPNNLLKNGGFDLGRTDDWGGYENRVLSIENTETHEGAFCAKLRGGYSSAINQRVYLEAGRNYRVSVHGRWSEPTTYLVSAALEKEGGVNVVFGPPFEGSTWQQTSFTYTPTETADHIFWIWTGANVSAELYIDSASIILDE